MKTTMDLSCFYITIPIVPVIKKEKAQTVLTDLSLFLLNVINSA